MYIGRALLGFFAGSLFLGLGLGLTAAAAYGTYKLLTDDKNKAKKSPYPYNMQGLSDDQRYFIS